MELQPWLVEIFRFLWICWKRKVLKLTQRCYILKVNWNLCKQERRGLERCSGFQRSSCSSGDRSSLTSTQISSSLHWNRYTRGMHSHQHRHISKTEINIKRRKKLHIKINKTKVRENTESMDTGDAEILLNICYKAL